MDALTSGTRPRHSKTFEFCRRLINHNYSPLVFAETDGVSPTNNASAKSLRRAVLFRKLSSSTEFGSGRDVLATTFSFVESCRRLGGDAQICIREAINAYFRNRTPPKLIT